jgi:hypothetical protein
MSTFHFCVADAGAPWIGEFHHQQALCYARYGAIAAVTTPEPGDGTRYLIVTHERTMVAGIRIHARSETVALPLEACLAVDEYLGHQLASRAASGVAELAGLWSSASMARTGIGGYIVAAAVAIAPLFALRHMCSFAHQFNRFTREVGFEPDARVGEHPYPDPRYRSTLNWCDALELPTATPQARARIVALRDAASTLGPRAPVPLRFQPPTRDM